ncbi:MAG: multidrug effflux MFS transporter [Caulobacteraceae bacterium]|nr:multidrug effflux MFS transporter [Caulobacteraceae bacterium]
MSEFANLSSAKTAPHVAAKISLGLVLLLGALTAFAPISIDMYLPSLPTIGRDLGGSASDAQITLATFLAGLAIGQFFYGPASDRWGRRWPLLFGIGLYIVGSAACALAPTMPMLALARFVQALGGCAGPVIGRAAVRDRYDARDSARVLSLLMLVMGLAPVVAPFIGAALLIVSGWRALFWVLFGFGGLMGVLTLVFLGETRSAETAAQARGEHPARAYLTLMGHRQLLGYIVSGALSSAAVFAYVSAAPGLVMGFYGVPAGHFVWIFGANAASMIAMSQANGWLLRHRTPERILMSARPISVIFAFAMALDAWAGWGGIWGVLVPLFFVFGTFGFIGPNTMAAGLSLDPRRMGSISALMGGVQFGVGALVSALITAMHDNGPRPLATVILVCMAASTLALYTLAQPKAERG